MVQRRGTAKVHKDKVFLSPRCVPTHAGEEKPASHILLRFDPILRLPDAGGAVREDDAVQMIDLMLEDARQPAFRLDLHRLAVAIQPFDLDRKVTLHLPNQSRHGEAALDAHDLFFGGFHDLRILYCPDFLGRVLLLFIFFMLKIFDHDNNRDVVMQCIKQCKYDISCKRSILFIKVMVYTTIE